MRATVDGTVKAVRCREGELVQPGEDARRACGRRIGDMRPTSRSPSSKSVRVTDCRTRRRRFPPLRRSSSSIGFPPPRLPVIEVSAFVSARWVPQMSDADAVFAGITRAPETRYAALVPNLAGLERARAAGVGEIGIFAAASEQFSKQEHQSDHRRVTRSIPRHLRASERAGHPRPRLCLDSVRMPFRRRRASGAGCGCRRSTDRDGCVRGGGQRHHRYRPPGTGSTCRRRGSRARRTRTDSAAFSRHARHGAGKRADRARPRHRNVRCVRRRARRMPVRSRRNGQRRHRGPRVHARGLGIRTGVNLDAVVEASAVHRAADRSPASVALLPSRAKCDEPPPEGRAYATATTIPSSTMRSSFVRPRVDHPLRWNASDPRVRD